MKSLKGFASILWLAVIFVLAQPEAAALGPTNRLLKAGISLPVLIVFGVVCCLVIGVALRTLSKPAAELSLNQRTK